MGDGTEGAFPLLSAEVSQEALCVQTYPLYHSFTHSFILGTMTPRLPLKGSDPLER